MNEPVASEMSTFLTTLGTIVTQMLAWVGNVGGAILADPVLTFSLGVFALGAAVGKRNMPTINPGKKLEN